MDRSGRTSAACSVPAVAGTDADGDGSALGSGALGVPCVLQEQVISATVTTRRDRRTVLVKDISYLRSVRV
jgi:hypothetical protein